MSQIGFMNVHAFISNAQIPLKDVAVTITDSAGDALAFRLTNTNGQFEKPIQLEVPDLAQSQSPGSASAPFSVVNIYARKENYEEIYVKNIQIFPATVTIQNLELIPLSEFPEQWNKAESFDTPPQSL